MMIYHIIQMKNYFPFKILECDGPLTPEVVQSTAMNRLYPANSVLILGEEDIYDHAKSQANFWLAKHEKATGQGFIVKVDSCARLIAGCQIKNKGKGSRPYWATKEFRISGSKNQKGPWETLVKDHLADTRGKPASLLNYTFEEPVEVQFLKFDLISYWGTDGGGLQYFAAIPCEYQARQSNLINTFLPVECNITTWSEWTACCNREKRRMRTALREAQCKVVTEVESCIGDNCPGHTS